MLDTKTNFVDEKVEIDPKDLQVSFDNNTTETKDTETNNESTSDTVDDIKAKITAIQKSLNPMEKTKAKAALTENNLPLAIKSITDMETLTKIYDVLSTFNK